MIYGRHLAGLNNIKNNSYPHMIGTFNQIADFDIFIQLIINKSKSEKPA